MISNRRALVWAMKYIPVIGTIVYTLHVGLLLLGYDLHLAEYLVGFSVDVTILLFLLSNEFDFCLLHKCLIGYVTLVDVCILLRRCGLFDKCLYPLRVIVFIMGLALIAWLICKFKAFNRHGLKDSR